MTEPGPACRTVTRRDPRIATWRLLLLSSARLSRRLDEDLRAAHGLSLPEYEALLQIAQSPGGRIRMSQLASETELSKSGVTRLVDRLVDDGFVQRCQCSHDARGAEAVLTAAGQRRLHEAVETHLEGLDRLLVGAVDPADRASFERAMAAISRQACEPERAG
jgi:DNA-binding MarR family transcriptional regulator